MLRRGRIDQPTTFPDIEANGSSASDVIDNSKSKSKFRPLQAAIITSQKSPRIALIVVVVMAVLVLTVTIFSLLPSFGGEACHVYIMGRSGEGREINGVYTLMEEAHNSKPMFQNNYRHHKLNTLHLYFADNGNWHISYDFGADHALAYAHGTASSSSDEILLPHQIRTWFVWDGGKYKKDVRVKSKCVSDTEQQGDTLQLIEMEKIVVSLTKEKEDRDEAAEKLSSKLRQCESENNRIRGIDDDEEEEEEEEMRGGDDDGDPQVVKNPPPMRRTGRNTKSNRNKNRRTRGGIGAQP